MKRCGAEHEGKTCILPEGLHADHSDGRAIWGDASATAVLSNQPRRRSDATKGRTPKPTAQSVERLRQIGLRARPETHVNPLNDGRPHTGVPTEAKAAWDREGWVEQTKAALHAFLAARAEPFTTPEDFWPLVDAPAEMRALSVVVQHALRSGWMVEIGGKRLRETYHSRDGVEFAMNKIVPIYQSQIRQPSEESP